MPVSEKEAGEAISSLPESSWLFRYLNHAIAQTTAPFSYHIGVGLSILGTTCPIDYGMNYAGVLRANNFCLLVGRSGEDQKSTALNVGRTLLDKAAHKLVGSFPGSPEGLIDSLSQSPSQLIPMSEFGRFLSSAQRGYFEPMKTLLADLWDANPTDRRMANNKQIRVDNPRLSVMAACSIPYLEKHTLAEDWTGGFMGRWMVFYGIRERSSAFPSGNNADVPFLVDWLKAKVTTSKAGWCSGLDSGAAAYWNHWYTEVSNRKLPDNIIGIRTRAPTIALKVALALGWDYGPASRGQPWKIDMKVLDPAIEIAELHIKSLVHLSEVIAEHADARLRRSIFQAIGTSGGLATLGEILGCLKLRKRPIIEMLDAMMEEGVVEKHTSNLGTVYRVRRINGYGGH